MLSDSLADPLCDACVAGLGALGCKHCIQNEEVWDSVMQDIIVPQQPRIIASLQKQYCDTPKLNSPQPSFTLAASVSVAGPMATLGPATSNTATS